jgi:DNA polymerase-3 subunit epsilon
VEALKVHGYNDEFLSKQKKFNEIGNEFIKFIKDKRLIIHNADFDLTHLNNELKIFGKKPIENDVIDTLVLARDKFPGSQVSLDALCKRFRIDNSRRVTHTALIDCDLLAKVYINLIDQKEPTLDFQNQNLEIQQNDYNVSYYKKVINPTTEEIDNHKQYLKNTLKKNFF